MTWQDNRTLTAAAIVMLLAGCWCNRGATANQEPHNPVKQVLQPRDEAENLLKADAWRGWGSGFTRQGELFVCDNGADAAAQRGASQTIRLDQQTPEPIIASAWSRAENVTGTPDSNYALYLDLVYTDGDHLWGQTAPFDTGTHDWQQRRVIILPDKPVATVSLHLLLRGHGGKAWFRDARLQVQEAPAGAIRFDGVPVVPKRVGYAGFQLRDVAANSDYLPVKNGQALGTRVTVSEARQDGATFFDVELQDTTGRDRAVTLVYSVPAEAAGAHWLQDPRRSVPVESAAEYANTSRFRVGSNGRLSRYPLGAVAAPGSGLALGVDLARPAFFRVCYNAACQELYIAFDIGLAPEKPTARVRFCRFGFDPAGRFRAALAKYYDLFPNAFTCRVPQQGLWMPFARISKVRGWEDFGFKFKEGNNETAWDDAHDIITFRYTEPMTWWMRMPADVPRTYQAALDYAHKLADQQEDSAQALLSSGFHDESGRLVALIRDVPWCDGAVWSMNSMPGISGTVTDFRLNWNERIKARHYGDQRDGDLDGEYIDSSEGYVTAELDFRRDHFAAADTPLCFALDSRKPAIFRGLVAFEYIRAIAHDVHAMDRLMMANSTPIRLCWLAPLLDVLGSETNWNPGGTWRPMSDEQLLYRRVMCKGKPYCFLMNTEFEKFPHERVEKYMKRALAYGMFPGFFSHNASQGHYFTRPELYNRDRPLFQKYVPLCRLVAEAGWQPLTRARSSNERVHVERFGERYLTVFNDSQEQRTAEIQLDQQLKGDVRELVKQRPIRCRGGRLSITLAAEDVAVLDLRP